jgi:hypothetical protein
MLRHLFAIGIITSLASGIGCAADRKYVKHVQGKEVIVHTNLAPVLLHRISPPYLGKHIHERGLQKGRLPRGRR